MALNEKGPFVAICGRDGRWVVNSKFKYIQFDAKNCFLVKKAPI